MTAGAVRTTLTEIQPLRALFLQEINTQVRYDACHARGWSDSYLLTLDDVVVGYGSVKGRDRLQDRDTVFEFYIVPPFRKSSRLLFTSLVAASRAAFIECQSNDASLTPLLYEFGRDVGTDTVLFEDDVVTQHACDGAVVRLRRDDDRIFAHGAEPVGDYVVDVSGDVVATGGFLLHYNVPFADLYMEVRADRRRQGYGSFLLQEVKKACYLAGRVPAARTGVDNLASRATLAGAGLRVSGFMLKGTL